jgi:hypothetical protein
VLRAGKTKTFKTLKGPMATHGAKSWILNKGTGKRLPAFGREVFKNKVWGN